MPDRVTAWWPKGYKECVPIGGFLALFVLAILNAVYFILADKADLAVWVGGALLFFAGIFGMFAPSEKLPWIREFAPELVSISFGILAIDRLYQFRLEQQDKQAVIRQVRSQSNEFSHDAVRVIQDNGWHLDGTLGGAFLKKANMSEAELNSANLEGANLAESNLAKATLMQANLSDTNLMFANLSQAVLRRADLSKSTLVQANLAGADLVEADLSNANLQMANLSGTDLSKANLSNADLRQANLSNAGLAEAKLTGARLSDTKFPGAVLVRADLSRADLSNADLSGATLLGTKLSGVAYSQGTRWPPGQNPYTWVLLQFGNAHR